MDPFSYWTREGIRSETGFGLCVPLDELDTSFAAGPDIRRWSEPEKDGPSWMPFHDLPADLDPNECAMAVVGRFQRYPGSLDQSPDWYLRALPVVTPLHDMGLLPGDRNFLVLASSRHMEHEDVTRLRDQGARVVVSPRKADRPDVHWADVGLEWLKGPPASCVGIRWRGDDGGADRFRRASDAQALDLALEHLDELRLRMAYSLHGMEAVSGDDVSAMLWRLSDGALVLPSETELGARRDEAALVSHRCCRFPLLGASEEPKRALEVARDVTVLWRCAGKVDGRSALGPDDPQRDLAEAFGASLKAYAAGVAVEDITGPQARTKT